MILSLQSKSERCNITFLLFEGLTWLDSINRHNCNSYFFSWLCCCPFISPGQEDLTFLFRKERSKWKKDRCKLTYLKMNITIKRFRKKLMPITRNNLFLSTPRYSRNKMDHLIHHTFYIQWTFKAVKLSWSYMPQVSYPQTQNIILLLYL